MKEEKGLLPRHILMYKVITNVEGFSSRAPEEEWQLILAIEDEHIPHNTGLDKYSEQLLEQMYEIYKRRSKMCPDT
jgi:hypothetical protein